MTITLLKKSYDGEGIIDASRDFTEVFDERFTPELATIPQDEYGIHEGKFVVTVEWFPEEE